METILHFIGLCPDTGAHTDLIDLFAVYGFLFNNLSYVTKSVFIYAKYKLFT